MPIENVKEKNNFEILIVGLECLELSVRKQGIWSQVGWGLVGQVSIWDGHLLGFDDPVTWRETHKGV